MILLCGVPDESPMYLLQGRLDELHEPYILFDQRDFTGCDIEFEISGGIPRGWMQVKHRRFALDGITAVYARLHSFDHFMKDQQEVGNLERHQWYALHGCLVAWMETTSTPVVNRPSAMGSNASKPYQSQFIRDSGFTIPETLITNDPDLLRGFFERHHNVVYKSISSTRSIVRKLGQADLGRLEMALWCPVQLQSQVQGVNVRIHVIEDTVLASEVLTKAIDYRYAHQEGYEAHVRAVEVTETLADKCKQLARSLELPFAGIDLVITPQGDPVCLEVNPSPAFSYYELKSGQPISMALAKYLTR